MLKSFKFFHQVLAIVLTAYLLASALAYVVTRYYVNSYNNTLSASLQQEVLDATARFLRSEEGRLGGLTQSHAQWTDLVDRSNAMDSPWIRENATEYLTLDPNFKVDEIYFKNYNSNYTERFGELPLSVFESLSSLIDIKNTTQQYHSYLVTYNSHLYILTASALSNSDGTNPSGIYFQGSRVDEELIKMLGDMFSSRAEISVQVLANKEPHILSPDFSTFSTLMVNDLKINILDVYLVNSISINTDKLLLLLLIISIPAVLAILTLLYRISLNVKRSLDTIKNITYHDYTHRITLGISEEFTELGNCINNLSEGLQRRDQEIERKYFEIISVLIKTLEEVDIYTKGHSERVSHYSTDLAIKTGYEDIESIRISGLLHDIGKITIGSTILNKPGRLDDHEFAIIKRHPEIACNILALSDVFQFAKDIVKHHHEKYDGTGYPSGLKGEEIPLGARIVAIADVYDALTSARSYRSPMTPDDALKIISEGSGSHFDPVLVEAFKGIAHSTFERWYYIRRSPEADELVEI